MCKDKYQSLCCDTNSCLGIQVLYIFFVFLNVGVFVDREVLSVDGEMMWANKMQENG